MVIGITGYAQHGKNTVGDILVNNHDFIQLAFADKVKECALAINPIIFNHIGNNIYLNEYVSKLGWDEAKKHSEVRRLLQHVGTDMGRVILGQNIWIDLVMKQIESNKDYVITDVRFQNEVDAIHLAGGEIWRILRPFYDNNVGTRHISESGIDSLDTDRVIMNNGTIEDLENKVYEIYRKQIKDS